MIKKRYTVLLRVPSAATPARDNWSCHISWEEAWGPQQAAEAAQQYVAAGLNLLPSDFPVLAVFPGHLENQAK